MGNALRTFLKRPTTIVGVLTALMFQVIFSVIWMTGYEGITDAERLKQLHVGIVTLDTQSGPAIAEKLAQSLPVQTRTLDGGEAQQLLNERELQMVITIPENFTESLKSQGSAASIQYSINESNPALIKSMMSSIAGQVTATVNKEAVGQGVQAVLTQAKLPAEQAAGAGAVLSERVTSDFTYTNPVKGMNNQMVPMMMVLASYVGAMIMGMNLEQSAMAAAASGVGKWHRFAARNVINIVAAVIVSLVGSSLVLALGGQAEHGFMAMWGFQALFVLTFMFLSQLFLLLFGMGGMLLNIIMLSAQLVSSGAMVPRELLSDFYLGLSKLLPATYAVEGNMNLLFGGAGNGGAIMGLLIIMAVSLALGAAIVGLRKNRVPQPMMSAARSQ
ncbi:YhgE/Pip domain-containing protein [Paenibacillus mendelii]|uniref:YhgE/Pip domain-containing protein n=1 Tax=Paenibacillus mendelii TaxID=206163 RepID=A0ABV6JBQ5_9BACL|nr:ABC transporter permease [Paenibacillus mendelii]MCQ6562608.1 ABC transporter permease [Paenibacillus mendelii]